MNQKMPRKMLNNISSVTIATPKTPKIGVGRIALAPKKFNQLFILFAFLVMWAENKKKSVTPTRGT